MWLFGLRNIVHNITWSSNKHDTKALEVFGRYIFEIEANIQGECL